MARKKKEDEKETLFSEKIDKKIVKIICKLEMIRV